MLVARIFTTASLMQMADGFRRVDLKPKRSIEKASTEDDATPTPAQVSYGGLIWPKVLYDYDGTIKDQWLAVKSTGNSNINDVYSGNHVDGGVEESKEENYKWQVRSNFGSGFFKGSSEYQPDPKEDECVKYGDIVYLQVQRHHHRWLSGARVSGETVTKFEGVYTRNWLGNPGSWEWANNETYQWRVMRSDDNTGCIDSSVWTETSGSVSDEEQCVKYYDAVCLQNYARTDRWLSGNRNRTGLVISRNPFESGYEYSVRDTYRWQFGHTPTEVSVAGAWQQVREVGTCHLVNSTFGWSESATQQLVVKAGATAEGVFMVGGVPVHGEVYGGVEWTATRAFQSNGTYSEMTLYCEWDGAYLWQWKFEVARENGVDAGSVNTDFVVPADERPHCLPGMQKDKNYITCQPGQCIYGCGYLAGDTVKIMGSGKVGTITSMPLETYPSGKPVYVTFSDGSAGDYFPELAICKGNCTHYSPHIGIP